MRSCPKCGWQLFGLRLSTEREAESIRAWAADRAIVLTRGNLLKPQDAAGYTGRSLRTVRRWIDEDLESANVRGRRFIPVEALAAFIVQHEVAKG